MLLTLTHAKIIDIEMRRAKLDDEQRKFEAKKMEQSTFLDKMQEGKMIFFHCIISLSFIIIFSCRSYKIFLHM